MVNIKNEFFPDQEAWSGQLQVFFTLTAYDAAQAPTAKSEYLRVLTSVKDLLREHSPEDFLITLLGRVKYPSKNKKEQRGYTPSIYISCPKPSRLLQELVAIDTPLRIEIHTGNVQPLAELPEEYVPSTGSTEFEQKITMGRSIGVKDNDTSGTFGGWVFDVDNGSCYGVTAGHVVAAQSRGQIPSLPVKITEKDNITLTQPSDQDFHKDLKSEQKKHHQRIVECVKLSQQNKRAEGSIPSLLRRLAGAVDILVETENQMQEFLPKEREFGSVLSAIVGVDGQWQDYALLIVNQDRIGKNCLFRTGNRPPLDIQGHIDPQKDMYVTKVNGRTTGCMNGIINAVKAQVALTDRLCKNGITYETEECIIVPQPRKVFEMGGLFSHVGDSGALCVERSSSTRFRRVIGMMFGGHRKYTSKDNESLDITFLTPASQLLKWWKEKEGLNLEFGMPGLDE
ncbi:hypothetical protein BGX38DRAFT_1215828 [Terfezia claveryi]|nr:hypothetical protein BGX38DRAFT_1215828 [Terfezia claveryi]